MESLHALVDGSTVPVVTAFLLGLLTAVSPCPLATNIAAVGYISKEVENPRRILLNGLLYTLGRVAAYSLLGAVLIALLRQGSSVYFIERGLGRWGEWLIAPALVLMGLLLLLGERLRLPRFGFSGGERIGRRGGWGALLLGALFSLAFCPTSGVIYFGMLMPLSAAQTGGYLLPAVFAAATGLPVAAVAWLLAYGVGRVGAFYDRMRIVQKWMTRLTALILIAVGIYYAIICLS